MFQTKIKTPQSDLTGSRLVFSLLWRDLQCNVGQWTGEDHNKTLLAIWHTAWLTAKGRGRALQTSHQSKGKAEVSVTANSTCDWKGTWMESRRSVQIHARLQSKRFLKVTSWHGWRARGHKVNGLGMRSGEEKRLVFSRWNINTARWSNSRFGHFSLKTFYCLHHYMSFTFWLIVYYTTQQHCK